MMFFYKIGAYGYEESYESFYVSHKEYTQKEFDNILYKTYEKLCYKILEEEKNSPCFNNIFFDVEFSVFTSLFDQLLLEDYGLEKINPKNLTSSITFDLTHYDREEVKYTDKLYDILCGLNVDTTCYKDCSRLQDDDMSDEDKKYFKKDCLVTRIIEYPKKEF